MAEAGGDSGMFTNQMSRSGEDIEARICIRNGNSIERNVSDNMVSGDRHVDEIDEWAGSLAGILEDVPRYMCNPGHPGKITRIPQNLREVDVKAYEPYFISIGPYHHDKASVKPMEMRKRICLKGFLEVKPELTLKDYVKEFNSIEPRARTFYSDVEMNSEQFVQMLLFDSLFILALFCGMPVSQGNDRREDSQNASNRVNQISEERGTLCDNLEMLTEDESYYRTASQEDETPRLFATLFTHDLFLLENQLPFFVLQKIYAFAYGGTGTQLIHIFKETVGGMLADYTKQDSEIGYMPIEEIHHLLHLCHMFFRPRHQLDSSVSQLNESSQMFRLGSAVQLYEAGVRFAATSGSNQHSLLDITFSHSGEMVMPCLCVEDNTNSLLRNLIALEQMKYPNLGLNVSAYAVLLLHLITTPEDARLLRRKGLIQHHLASDKEMMYLVNKLSVGLSFDYAEDDYSLKPVFRELKRYTERRVPRWRAWLKHRYFKNPWTMISLVAASSLLLLTIVETYYTVYSYYQPCEDCHQ